MYIFKTDFSTKNFLDNKDNPLAAGYIRQIDEACSRFRGTPITPLPFRDYRLYDEVGDRAVFEKSYFSRRLRLTMFMMRVWLYGEADDIAELEDILWEICNEYSWALPAHTPGIISDDNISRYTVDLFSAETGHTMAEALSIVGDKLCYRVKKRCIDEISERIFAPFESGEIDKYRLWWINAHNNWAAVCGGSVGMAAVYLIEDDERMKKITDRCKQACSRFIESCTNDGVCLEGLSYWDYAMQYYVGFDELVKERTGEGISCDEEKMKNIAAFPSVACLEHNSIVSFSDCCVEKPNLRFGILCRLKDVYNVDIPAAEVFEILCDDCSRTCGITRTIAWFNPEYVNTGTDKKDVFLPEGQWALCRINDNVLAIKGGHNDEPHNHNDVGTYIYMKNGIRLSDDFGSPKYDKNFFTAEHRYSYINASMLGHSLPVVNGISQCEGREYCADYFKKVMHGAEVSFAGAYPAGARLKSLIRNAQLQEDGALSITDSFKFSSCGNTVKSRIVTKLDARISDGEVILSGENGDAGRILPKQKCGISIEKTSYLLHIPYENEDGTIRDVQEITLIDFVFDTESDSLTTEFILK